MTAKVKRQFETLERRDMLTVMLVEDVNLAPDFARSGGFGGNASVTLFSMQTSETGQELWTTDGTAEGTKLLKDLIPGPASSYPSNFVPIRDQIFFTTGDADSFPLATSLWVTNEATDKIVELLRVGADQQINNIIPDDDRLIFSVVDNQRETQFWSSDGTIDGTRPLQEKVFDWPASAIHFNDQIYVGGESLRVFDESNEPNVVDFSASVEFEIDRVNLLRAHNGKIFLAIYGPDDMEIWVTDGEATHTRLASLNGRGVVRDHNVANGRVFVDILVQGVNQTIWASDGTAEGTRRISTPEDRWALSIGAIENDLYYYVYDQAKIQQDIRPKVQLWSTNGTESGTQLRTEIPSLVRSYQIADGHVWFRDPESNHYVRYSPGVGVDVAFEANDFDFLSVFQDRLFFSTRNAERTSSLWISDDDSAEGKRLLLEFDNGTRGSDFWQDLVADEDNLYFVTREGSNYTVWWRHAGSEKSQRVYQTEVGRVRLHLVDGRLLLLEDQLNTGNVRLVHLDLDQEPEVIKAWDPIFTVGDTVTVANDRLYFRLRNTDPSTPLAEVYSVWSSDGTVEGTVQIALVDNLSDFAASDDSVYFIGDSSGNSHIWKSDGTAEGTLQLNGSTGKQELFTLDDGVLYFKSRGNDETALMLLRDGEEETEIWREEVVAHQLEHVGNRTYFHTHANEDDGVSQLWTTDGTSEGTVRLLDVEGVFWRLSGLGDDLLFTVDNDGVAELWISDGTQDGTRLVRDLGTKKPDGHFVYGDGERAYFVHGDDFFGSELWVTDGTGEGTVLYDVNRGLGGSNPGGFVVWQDKLHFHARGENVGRELWRLEPTAPLIGDLNDDGRVSFEDFLILSQNFGQTSEDGFPTGDINGDHEVSFADFLLLSAHFGDEGSPRVVSRQSQAVDQAIADF